MKRILFVAFSAAFLQISPILFSQAQSRGGFQGTMPMDAKVTGTIIDQESNQGVEYASVAIYRQKDSTLITGVMSITNGNFVIENLPYGKFYLEINFVGYKKQRFPNVLLIPNQKNANLGQIKIASSSTAIKEVEVVGNKSGLEYRIDKKVVDVTQNAVAAGGTVVDALQNTPSVQTDVEGNVTLRGSSNFTVLIDGKPSPISGSEALQQIPASIVQSVEIITNPSAKFDAEGSAGIINVVMKKQKIRGMNGVVNITAGTGEKYSGNINVNYKHDKFNFSIGADFANMKFGADNKAINTYDSVFYKRNLGIVGSETQAQNGNGSFHRQGQGFKGGIDYNINNNNTLSLSGSWGNRTFMRTSGYNSIDQYSKFDSIPLNRTIYSSNNTNGKYSRDYYNFNLDYQLKLNDKGEQLSASFYLAQGPEDRFNINFQDTTNVNWIHEPGKKTVNTQTRQIGNETEFRAKADYTLPLGEKGKLEAGYQGRYFENLGEQHLDTALLNNIWYEDFSQKDFINFIDKIHAGYATLSNQTSVIDFMAGLRVEYENRNFRQEISNHNSKVEQWNFFPSFHFSKQLPWDLQIQASYTKRISRPRDWNIDPLHVQISPTRIQYGNPDLLPEITHSYELNLQKKFNEASFFSIEGFYRLENNSMQQVNRSISDTLYSTTANYKYDRSSGVELMLNLSFAKWFNFNASSSIYNDLLVAGDKAGMLDTFRVAGISKSLNTWDIKISPTFRLSKGTSIQLNYQYNAPSNTGQGIRKGNYSNSLGIRQDLLKHKGSLTLQVRDFIPGSDKYITTSNLGKTNTYQYFKRENLVVMLTFSYRINNYKAQQAKRPEEINNGNGGEDMNGF